MRYDPFARGGFPVGVRTVEVTDPNRSRHLPVEVWYPADASLAGKDTCEESMDHYDLLPGFPPLKQACVRDAKPSTNSGRCPIVMFSHGFGGHRRQSTFFCTHLASHGYTVAAVDHTGNTVIDMAQMTLQVMMGEPMPDPIPMVADLIVQRPVDISFVLDRLLAGDLGSDCASLDADRIGMAGHSFGGWTTLRVAHLDHRIRAALPMAPAGGKSPLPAEILREALDFSWGRDVPTLFLVADKDTLLPLEGMHELLAETRGTKRMIVLENADHMHFCDEVESVHEMFRTMPPPGPFAEIAKNLPAASELAPGIHAYDFSRSLGLAHMDASLRGNEEAASFLSSDLPSVFAARGIRVSVA
ncbi:MAG TPA: dienelactone hydrolase family protein [Candidatus Binatia bacterium]|jgi:predicted dienelactone hydrolase